MFQIENGECSLHVYIMEKIVSHDRCKCKFLDVINFHDFRENVERKFECQISFSLFGDQLSLEIELSV